MKCDEVNLIQTTLDMTRHEVWKNSKKSDLRYRDVCKEIRTSRKLILFFGIIGIAIQIVKEAL